MRRSAKLITLVMACALVGCGWFGNKPKTYISADGYHGCSATNKPFSLDAVYLSDTTNGIHGVVRLSWWNVFSVTLHNNSAREVAFEPDRFIMVDAVGNRTHGLSLDAVLDHRTHLMGPLMGYERAAITQSIWKSEPIKPGTFAVGYVFFPRTDANVPPWQLIFDPSDTKRKDEVVAVFPALREEYAARIAQGPPAAEIRDVAPEPDAVDTADEEAPVEAAPDASEITQDELPTDTTTQLEADGEDAHVSEEAPANP